MPATAAARPQVPRINPYSGSAVAAPINAPGSRNAASVTPPSYSDRATPRNQGAGRSAFSHSVPKNGAACPLR